MLDEKSLRKNIKSLFNAGWTNGCIASTLSKAGSFGDEFSEEEILTIANEELKILNNEVVRENKLIAEDVEDSFRRHPELTKHFKLVGNTIKFVS